MTNKAKYINSDIKESKPLHELDEEPIDGGTDRMYS